MKSNVESAFTTRKPYNNWGYLFQSALKNPDATDFSA
jgi:hypothetical protein